MLAADVDPRPGEAPPGGASRGPGAGLVSIVVPAYNEVATAERLLRRIAAVDLAKEVVVVDDGSTDGTRDLLARLKEEGLIGQLIVHARNRGKGAAVRTGFGRARGDIVVVQDADLEYDPAEIPRLVEPIAAGDADAVFGSRFLGGGKRALLSWHTLVNRLLTAISNATTGLRLTDMEVCHKAVRADLLRALPLVSGRFGIEPEITARLAQAGARVLEVPATYEPRGYADGKKIGWRDGLAAVWHILWYGWLGPKTRPWRPETARGSNGGPARPR